MKHTDECKMNFSEWCAELDRLSIEAGYMPNLVLQTGAESWIDFFDDGYSPRDALNEELLEASRG